MTNLKQNSALHTVVTIGEAAIMWQKHRNTVLMAMIQGKLEHRRSSGTWLISTRSLIALWGEPAIDWTGPVENVLPKYRNRPYA